MNLYEFNQDGALFYVTAPCAEDAIALLATSGSLDGVDDAGEMCWRKFRDDEDVRIWQDDDPDPAELAAPGASWDAAKRVLSMAASSWASLSQEPAVIGQSEW